MRKCYFCQGDICPILFQSEKFSCLECYYRGKVMDFFKDNYLLSDDKEIRFYTSTYLDQFIRMNSHILPREELEGDVQKLLESVVGEGNVNKIQKIIEKIEKMENKEEVTKIINQKPFELSKIVDGKLSLEDFIKNNIPDNKTNTNSTCTNDLKK